MSEKKDIKRFLLAITVGGVCAVATLFSLMGLIAILLQDSFELLNVLVAAVSFVLFSILTLWATGFWGRWGMLAFFAFAPVVIIVDFSINPVFPLGSIEFGAACYGIRARSKPHA